MEPRVGKSVAQVHTANEPVSGIQIKFCVAQMPVSIQSTHTCFKRLLNTIISSEGTPDMVAKTQNKKSTQKKKECWRKKANIKRINPKLSPGVGGFHWR